jgi:hypothetical protein
MRKLTEFEVLKNPMEWPRWPLLPLVHRKRDTLDNVGILLADENFASGKYFVYVGVNMFAISGKKLSDAIAGVPVEEYTSLEKLNSDWRVD